MALIIILAIVVGIGEAIAPLLAVMFLVGFVGFIIYTMTSASKESQEKYPIKQKADTIPNQPEVKITEANVVSETIKALDSITSHEGEAGATVIVVIGLIEDVEALDPATESIKKQIQSFHKNYYPILIQAINSCRKIARSEDDYKQAWEKLNDTLWSISNALEAIIKENSEGNIAELSVNINLLNSLLSKDGFKEEGKMKL